MIAISAGCSDILPVFPVTKPAQEDAARENANGASQRQKPRDAHDAQMQMRPNWPQMSPKYTVSECCNVTIRDQLTATTSTHSVAANRSQKITREWWCGINQAFNAAGGDAVLILP